MRLNGGASSSHRLWVANSCEHRGPACAISTHLKIARFGYRSRDVAENFAELVVDGHRILPALLADIAAAERAIHISIFLFFHDPIGEEIAAALEAKARAGVDVRVLLNIQKTHMGDPFSTGE